MEATLKHEQSDVHSFSLRNRKGDELARRDFGLAVCLAAWVDGYNHDKSGSRKITRAVDTVTNFTHTFEA